jgi:imidazolonepropionase
MIGAARDNAKSETILVRGARQLLTLRGPAGPRRGPELGELGIVLDGSVLIRQGKILQAGPSRRVENLAVARNAREINAAGRVVIPGFVDGAARLWIPQTGSNPAASAADDAESWRGWKKIGDLPAPRLEARARDVLAGMARHGTTTVSAATSPASIHSSELKMLRVLAILNGKPLDVIPAYGGAKFLPPGLEGIETAYIEALCTDFLPVISRRKLARFAAVNCELFAPAAARRYLDCARKLGFRLSVRRGTSAYAVPLALEMDAALIVLDGITQGEISELAKSRTMAQLTPASAFQRRPERYVFARPLIESGVAVALASGFGIQGSPTYNMQMVISLACSEMKMSPAEAISAATINAAHATGCNAQCGSLEPGKRADMLFLNVEDYRDPVYRFGINHVHMVLKNGAVVYQEGEVTD